MKFKSTSWNSKVRVQIHELRVQIHELWVQIYELRVQIYELRVQINELQVQIYELRVQIAKRNRTSYVWQFVRQVVRSASGENVVFCFSTILWLRLQQETLWVNIIFVEIETYIRISYSLKSWNYNTNRNNM